jgi:tripartite-type tricarboxylate transporter receptor subunit TctC
MNLRRRRFLELAVTASAGFFLQNEARAKGYPVRTVRLLVGYPPAGATDIIARVAGQWLSERLGQAFVVENRPGASGNLATESLVNSPPDGYTLMLVNAGNTINSALYAKLGFAFLRDVAPVASIVRVPLVMLVNPSLPVRTVPEFVAYAKANPGRLNMASAGTGTPQHVSGELFKMMTGVDLTHVPYRGSAPALTDLLAGRVQVAFDTTAASLEYVKAGTLRPLAVTIAAHSEALPDIPTVASSVPGYEASGWYGLGAPRKTPPDIIEKLNKAMQAGLADPKIRARLADLGATIFPGAPADFAVFIAAETEKWARVVKFSGARAD